MTRETSHEWDRISIGRAQLCDSLADFIHERGEVCSKDPFKVQVNADKPPVLVLTCSGRIKSPDQVDNAIEHEIMEQHVRDNMSFFENNMRVVIDLRQVRDVYSYAFECICYRWAPYLAHRSEVVVLIIQPGRVQTMLEKMACLVNLPELMVGTRVEIVARSRDVGSKLTPL